MLRMSVARSIKYLTSVCGLAVILGASRAVRRHSAALWHTSRSSLLRTRRGKHMKPPHFTYHDPVTRSEVLTLLNTYADDAKVLAGGQSLIPLLNMRLTQPMHLVDINRLPDLAYIREEDGGLAI